MLKLSSLQHTYYHSMCAELGKRFAQGKLSQRQIEKLSWDISGNYHVSVHLVIMEIFDRASEAEAER